MNILQEMKNALEVLTEWKNFANKEQKAIASLRSAIEEVEKAEPVAIVSSVTSAGAKGVKIKWRGGFPQIGTKLYSHPALAIPEGWQLVPKEPTLEMIGAAEDQADCLGDFYRAMLAAAPEYKP